MPVSVSDLRAHLRASSAVPDTALQLLLDSSSEILDVYIGDVEVPDSAKDRALLLTATEMYHQDKAPNGVLNQQFDVGDGTITSTPVRIGSDPLRTARAVLALWVSSEYYCT